MAGNGISGTKKAKAIAALLQAKTTRDAAEQAGVGYRTLIRWLQEDEDFRAALTAAEDQAVGDAGRTLLAGQRLALGALARMITDGEKDSDKRQAAVAWLDLNLRYRDQGNVEERLARLEELYNIKR